MQGSQRVENTDLLFLLELLTISPRRSDSPKRNTKAHSMQLHAKFPLGLSIYPEPSCLPDGPS